MKTALWVGLASVAMGIVVAAVGCSANVETAGSGSGGGANGAGGGTTDTSGGGTPNPTGGVDPPTCTAAQPSCGPNAYCSFGGNCGADGLAGTCLPVPDCSNSGGQEVCGCDGKTYAFACLAFAAGVDVTDASACKPPLETFPCGDQFCTTGTYCSIIDYGGTPAHHDYACNALPPECGDAPSCDCLPIPACAVHLQCGPDTSGNLTLEWGYCD